MRVFDGVSALGGAIGTHVGFSPWRVVTQHQVDEFATITDDRQWIHVDPEAAARGPFGGTIAHGYLTLSLVSAMVWQVYRVDGVTVQVNYGADRLRFPSPVKVGSSVRAGVEIVDVAVASAGHRVVTRVTVEIKGQGKPACVVDVVSLLSS